MESPNQASFLTCPPVLGCHELIELGDILVLDVHQLLELAHVHLFHVLLARGPPAVFKTANAADHFGDALYQQKKPSNRDDSFEGVDGRAFSGDVRMLQDRPGFAGISVAGPAECGYAGQKKYEVQRQIDGSLQSRREKAISTSPRTMPFFERV